MNRFKTSAGETRSRTAPLFVAVFFAVLLLLGVLLFSRLSEDAAQEQKKSLETALMRGAMQCYALEGRYPESLSVLTERYSVVYDETKFYVDYRPVAENLLPDITVIPMGGGGA